MESPTQVLALQTPNQRKLVTHGGASPVDVTFASKRSAAERSLERHNMCGETMPLREDESTGSGERSQVRGLNHVAFISKSDHAWPLDINTGRYLDILDIVVTVLSHSLLSIHNLKWIKHGSSKKHVELEAGVCT